MYHYTCFALNKRKREKGIQEKKLYKYFIFECVTYLLVPYTLVDTFHLWGLPLITYAPRREGVKSPIHFHCVLNVSTTKNGGGGVQIACVRTKWEAPILVVVRFPLDYRFSVVFIRFIS